MVLGCLLLHFSFSASCAQRGQGGGIAEREKQAISQEFLGVTTDGTAEAGLFPVESTGVSTEPVRLAAQAFPRPFGGIRIQVGHSQARPPPQILRQPDFLSRRRAKRCVCARCLAIRVCFLALLGG